MQNLVENHKYLSQYQSYNNDIIASDRGSSALLNPIILWGLMINSLNKMEKPWFQKYDNINGNHLYNR